MKPDDNNKTFFNYRDNRLQPVSAGVVSEYPLQLIVNGREIATLIGSPHDLRFLVAGFLRLQGFVSALTDFEMFSICEEFGTANVKIKGELPERLKPVLTSGCGAGISFSMPSAISPDRAADPKFRVQPAHIFSLMEALAKKADHYRTHGGIHSAATGRSGRLMLYAEDLGRHNTFDRIAGEALFKGITLAGAELVTSGRVSTEMVAKAALMGIKLIASRTSPTDMAVKLCDQAGICLVGYVRGGSFNVYSHPEVIEDCPSGSKIEGVTGAILAGGSSSRMGKNKALMEVDGIPIIARTYRTMAELFHEVIIVTNTPQEYDFLPCRKVPDIHPEIGSIAGLHSALAHSTSERTFVAACDMPFVNAHIIRHLCNLQQDEYDAVIPFSEGGQEPLHAVYSSKCELIFENAIKGNNRKILDILAQMKTLLVTWEEIKAVEGSSTSFLNVNTQEEYGTIQNIR
ncbi:MAG: formate dehydrogenase accessory sulfurtransferase FdhD [Deltaproteobacteria bacterium]|nr:formate dehydrogenase accessory sulfurtransferase FdhD [Deltaproteobacteria bacterium]